MRDCLFGGPASSTLYSTCCICSTFLDVRTMCACDVSQRKRSCMSRRTKERVTTMTSGGAIHKHFTIHSYRLCTEEHRDIAFTMPMNILHNTIHHPFVNPDE